MEPIQRRCVSCVYFVNGNDDLPGSCHLNPPILMSTFENGTSEEVWTRPEVCDYDFCSHHKPISRDL